MEETLDWAYLTIEDFFNSKHIRSDDVDHSRSPEDLQFHFNKPGFDLAIILTDKSLIKTVASFQAPFQSKHGLTTHVIYLPDVSRLKFCIRDLKLNEILYAIVINEDSQKNDDYDLFILSDIIEFQKSMSYDGAVKLISDDFCNYMHEMKKMLNSEERYPHARNHNVEGFIEPNEEIRYLLCLLFDHRMLRQEELRALSSFVKMRKEALIKTGNRPIHYALNERPIPTFRRDKLKYFVYEHKQDIRSDMGQLYLDDDRNTTPVPNRRNEIIAAKCDSDMRVINPAVGHPRSYPNPAAVTTAKNVTQPQTVNQNFSKSVIITGTPQLYTNATTSKPSETTNNPTLKNAFLKPSSTSSMDQCQPNAITPHQSVPRVPVPVTQSQPNVVLPHKSIPRVTAPVGSPIVAPIGPSLVAPVSKIRPNISPMSKPPPPPPPFATPLSGNTSAAVAARKIKFAIAPATKPTPITHSVAAPKTPTDPTGSKASKDPNRRLPVPINSNSDSVHTNDLLSSAAGNTRQQSERSKSVASNQSDPLSDYEKDDYNSMYQLSPVSSESSEKMNRQGNMQYSKIEIDLTDDVMVASNDVSDSVPSTKKPRYSPNVKSSGPKSDNAGTYTLNLTEDNPSLQPKSFTINNNGFINFFKFILNMAPLSLPEHNVVIVLMKKCVLDMERYIGTCGIAYPKIDVRTCRTKGCTEIIKIIEDLTGETIASKHNVSDFNFMWTYFPKNMSDNSITVMFYKIMKMLELSKLVVATNAILVNLLQRIERVVYCNFQISEQKPASLSLLNFFPSLFSEYFSARTELHKLANTLPAPEPVTAVFNHDLDMTIMESKIKFVVGPLLEFFVQSINVIHRDLSVQKIETVYGAVRAARFSFRKISGRLLSVRLADPVPFTESGDDTDQIVGLLEEINSLLREVNILNCIMFTRRHYEFVSVLLDFAIEVRRVVEEGCDPDLESMCKVYIIEIDAASFVREFSTTIKTAVLSYHPDTEVDTFKTSLKNRWIDTLHQALKGIAPMPDGSRIKLEMEYLLPKIWSKHTFNEAVQEAALLSYSDWDKMLTNDLGRSRVKYNDVRNNYLLWLANNGLDHRKAMETMTSYQKTLDAKILEMSA